MPALGPLVLALALMVSGCGSGPSPADPSPAPEAAPGSTTAAARADAGRPGPASSATAGAAGSPATDAATDPAPLGPLEAWAAKTVEGMQKLPHLQTLDLMFADEDERKAKAAEAVAAAEADPSEDHCMKVGALYAQGLGVEADPKAALAWYRRAAEAGSSLACLAVFATGWDQDRAAALAAAEGFAADLDDGEDLRDILLPFRALVEEDLAAVAARADERKADLSRDAVLALGRHLVDAGDQHRDVGVRLLRYSLDSTGNPEAQAALAAAGVEAVDPMDEYLASLPAFEPSEATDPAEVPDEAQSTLMAHKLVAENLNEFGTMLLARSLEDHAERIQAAAARKEPEGLYQASLLALAASDEATSQRLLVEAAEAGWGPAAFRLANLARFPEEGEPDLAAGTRWLEAATKAGHPQAALALAVLRLDGPATAASFTRVREALLVAAHEGTKSTRGMAGDLLYWGNGAARDRREGLVALRKAAAEGFAAGAITLNKIRKQVLATRKDPAAPAGP